MTAISSPTCGARQVFPTCRQSPSATKKKNPTMRQRQQLGRNGSRSWPPRPYSIGRPTKRYRRSALLEGRLISYQQRSTRPSTNMKKWYSILVHRCTTIGSTFCACTLQRNIQARSQRFSTAPRHASKYLRTPRWVLKPMTPRCYRDACSEPSTRWQACPSVPLPSRVHRSSWCLVPQRAMESPVHAGWLTTSSPRRSACGPTRVC